MGKSIALILTSAAAIALASCGDSSASDQTQATPAPVAQPQPEAPRFTSAQIDAAKAALAEEPKIKDMLIADPANKNEVDWQIGILPDGTSGTGYAQYVCLRLAELKVIASAASAGSRMAPRNASRPELMKRKVMATSATPMPMPTSVRAHTIPVKP